MKRRDFLKVLATLLASSLARPGHALASAYTSLVDAPQIPNAPPRDSNMAPSLRVGIVSVGSVGRKILSAHLPHLPYLTRSVAIDSETSGHGLFDRHIVIRNGIHPPKSQEEAIRMGVQAGPLVEEAVAGLDVLFIVTGMGGIIGSGIAPIVARIAKEQNVPVVLGIPYLPFGFEGDKQHTNAATGYEALNRHADVVLPISHQMLGERFTSAERERITLVQYMDLTDTYVERIYSSVTSGCLGDGFVTLDLGDFKTLLGDKDCQLGFSRSSGSGEVETAIQEAAAHSLMSPDGPITRTGVFCLLECKSMEYVTLENFSTALHEVERLSGDSAIAVMSAVENPGLSESFRVTIIAG